MNILLAIDDSDAALHACRLVAAYAGDRSMLRVTLLHVQRPDAGIAAFARLHAADLIAMATRGRGAMHHLLMGSVALKTAHESEVPVVLMR